MIHSPSSVATIDKERAPSHEAASIRQREQSRTTELLRHRQAPEHILRFPRRTSRRILLEDLLNHGRNDVTRAKTVDPNAMPPPLHSQRARKLDHSRLGGIVHGARHALVGDEAAHAGHEQDRALLLVIEHLAGGGGGRVEDAVVVDGHDVVEGLLRVFQGALEVVDSRGGDQAVQALVLGGDRREDVVHFCVVADVDPHVLQAAAVLVVGFVSGGDEIGVWCFQAVEAVD